MERRYAVGVEREGNFVPDALGNDPDLTTFDTMEGAVKELLGLIECWPRISSGDELTDGAVQDNETGRIVWRQDRG